MTDAPIERVMDHYKSLPAVIAAPEDDDVTVSLLRKMFELVPQGVSVRDGPLGRLRGYVPGEGAGALSQTTYVKTFTTMFHRGLSTIRVELCSPRPDADGRALVTGTLITQMTEPRITVPRLTLLADSDLAVKAYPGATAAPDVAKRFQREFFTLGGAGIAAFRTTDPINKVLAYYEDLRQKPPGSSDPAQEALTRQSTAGPALSVAHKGTEGLRKLVPGLISEGTPEGQVSFGLGSIQRDESETSLMLVSPIPGEKSLDPGTLVVHLQSRMPRRPPPPPLPTVDGPEANLLGRMKGSIVGVEAGRLVTYRLADGSRKVLREKTLDSTSTHAASGPDDQGRVVYIENRMIEKRHTFRVIQIDGSGDRVLLERKGDALWERSVGMMALAPKGGTLAFVDAPTPRSSPAPGSSQEGRLMFIDLGSRALRDSSRVVADRALSWFPDGRRLMYTVETGQPGSDGSSFAIRILDVTTGVQSEAGKGFANLVSSDGQRILTGDFLSGASPLRGSSGSPGPYRLVDLASQGSTAVSCPGRWGGAIAFIDAHHLLYWGLPTKGAPARYTENNSPMVGPKNMGDLKVCDFDSGRFQTVVAGVDPRSKYSYGVVAPSGD